MYQETTFSATVSTELTASLQETLGKAPLRELEATVRLPESSGAFLWFLLSTLVICAGLSLYILFSVQTYRIQTQLTDLQAHYQTIERHNAELIWAISQESSLRNVQERAADLGYVVPQSRRYILP